MRKGVIIVLVLVFSSASFGGILYKTPSNTLVWEEDFTSSAHLDSYNSYIGGWGGGKLYINHLFLWSWDGPIVDIVVDRVNSRVYTVGELNVYSSFYGLQPFVNDGNFRYDVFANSYNLDGTKNWSLSVMARTNANDGVVTYYGVPSRFPVCTVDGYGNLYSVYSDQTNPNAVWVLVVQKISNNGRVLWGNSGQDRIIANTSDFQPAVVYYSNDNSVFVAYGLGGNIWLRKLNADTGADIWNVQVNTSGGNNYGVDMKLGPDGYLYLAWNNNTGGVLSIRGQRISPSSGSRISWGGTTGDKILNTNTNYSSANYWYGITEETVAIDFDSQTNMYLAFKHFRSGDGAKVFLQKIRCYPSGGNDFERMWSNDIKVAKGGGVADAYPDMVVMGDSVYVVWIDHSESMNDHAMLQRINKDTGQHIWDSDINLFWATYGVVYTNILGGVIYGGISHHARIASDGNFIYVVGSNPPILAKIDIFGNVVERVFLVDRYYTSLATFRTKNLFMPDTTSGVVPLNVRVRALFESFPPNSTNLFYVSPETNTNGASTNYVIFTNTSSPLLILSSQKGSVHLFILLDNRANGGTNTVILTNLKVEFVDYYFGDALVGRLANGSDALGNMVLNRNAINQMIVDYVYNDGLQSGKAFFFFVNQGTVSSNFRFRGTPGSPPSWAVRYWLCTNNGVEWVTNVDITSSVTGSGFVTNLPPGGISAVRVFVTPSPSLSSGSHYTVYGYIDTQLPSGGYAESDAVAVQTIVSSSVPDNRISADGVVFLGDDIRNTDGSGQTVTNIMDVGVEKRFYLIIRNRGGSDNIVLQGTSGDAVWSVRYFTNNVEITSSVVNGNFTNYLTYMSDSPVIEVRVSPTNASVPLNSVKDIVLRAVSSSDRTKEDIAKVIAILVSTKAELVVRKQGVSSWVGRNVFSTDYSQRVLSRIDNGLTNTFEVSLTNLGSYPQNYTLVAFNSNFVSGWNVRYFYGGIDITASITNQGFVISNLSPSNVGSNIVVRISAPLNYPTGANEVMGVYIRAYGDGDTNTLSKQDTVGIEDRLVSTRVDGIVVSGIYGSQGFGVITSDPMLQYIYTYVISNASYTIVLSNPSPSSYEFNIRITNANSVQWRIVVLDGVSNDITGSVTNVGGYTTPVIPSGGVYTLSLTVYSTNEYTGYGASVGQTNRVVIMVNSPIKPAVVDRLMVYAEKALPPDVMVKKPGEVLYRGVGLFMNNVTGEEQLVYNSYPNDDTTYKEGLFRVKNVRPVVENVVIRIKEVERVNNWDYKVYKYVGSYIDNPDLSNPSHWEEVTSQVTNIGGVTNSLTNGSDVLYRIRGKPLNATNNNDTILLEFRATGVDTRWEDVGSYKITFGVGLPDIYAEGLIGCGYVSTNYDVLVTNLFDKALGDLVRIYVSNRNSEVSGNFVLRGENDKDQWDITYYSIHTNDITSLVTGSGYLMSLGPSGTNVIFVRIKAIPGSTYSNGQTTNFDILVENDQGNVDTIRLVSVITDRSIPDVYLSSGWSNVYETVPSSQVLQTFVGRGDWVTNVVYFGNWRVGRETNWLYIVPPSMADFSFKVERLVGSSWVDITSEVTNMSDKHSLILDSSSVTSRIIVSVDSNTILPFNTPEEVSIQLESQGRLKVDRAKVRYILVDVGQPDVFVVEGSVTNGFGVYETSPLVQVSDFDIEKGITTRVYVGLMNRREKTETMKVWSSGSSYGEFRLTYNLSSDGVSWSNVTASITNPGGFNVVIPATDFVTLRIDALLTVDSTNTIGDVLETQIRLFSWAGVSNDNFRLRYVVKDKNRPDLFVSTIGSNVFYPPIPQTVTNLIEKGTTVTQKVTVMNAKSDRSSDFILNATGSYGDWGVRYFLDEEDVTYYITNVNAGVYISNLPPLGSRTLRILVTLASNSDYTLASNYNLLIRLYSYTRLVRDEFNVLCRVDDRGRPDVFVTSLHDNVYSPEVQEITNRIEEGETLTNYFYVQNDRSDRAELITIRGSYDTNTNWIYSVKVLNENGVWSDVTVEFTNAGYVVSVPSGSVVTCQVIMYLNTNSGIPSARVSKFSVEGMSQGRLISDVFGINFLVIKPRPDIYVLPVSSGGDLVGEDMYEMDAANIRNSVGKGYVMYVLPSIYSVIIENDDAVADSYVLRAFGEFFVENKWLVTVKDQNGEDVTLLVTNVGITNKVDPANSTLYVLEVKLIDPTSVKIGESNFVVFEVRSLKNTNKVDFVKVVTTRIESDVVGRVVEMASGIGVYGAIVEVYEARTGRLVKEVTTGNDGKFSLKLIPTTYRFVVRKDKYVRFEKEVTIPEVIEHNLGDFGLLRFNLKEDTLDIHSFPNPASAGDKVKIVLNVPRNSQLRVYIVSMSGAVVRKLVDGEKFNVGQYSFDWDLRTDSGAIVKNGVYLLVVNDGSEVVVRKVMVK